MHWTNNAGIDGGQCGNEQRPRCFSVKQCNPMCLFADIATHAYSKSLRGYFSGLDNDIVPVVVEFKSVAYVTNGTLRLTAQGLRIWKNQDHIGTPVQSLTMTNCATP